MKGRNRFTAGEADAIRDLLRRLRRADREEQKRLRNRLRQRLCFYISDFDQSRTGFTEADFDSLIERGAITVDRN